MKKNSQKKYQAVLVLKNITNVFQKMFGHKNGVDLNLSSRKPHKPMVHV